MIIYIVCAVFLYILISLLLYRLPNSREFDYFEGEVVFNFIELKMNHRDAFESIILRTQFLTLASEEKRFYISTNDNAMIWEISPHELSKAGYTLKLKLITRRLLFGGFGLSEIVEIVKIKKNPIITK
ncbi:MAG: hypothetical protein GY787_04135 [Alteromonadales bacterium]|nr:hypothetical protein [Alteromonadales bacterium]